MWKETCFLIDKYMSDINIIMLDLIHMSNSLLLYTYLIASSLFRKNWLKLQKELLYQNKSLLIILMLHYKLNFKF